MKNKMPLDGLGLGHDSGSVHCDMLKMLCFRTAWGGVFLQMIIISSSPFFHPASGLIPNTEAATNRLEQYP